MSDILFVNRIHIYSSSLGSHSDPWLDKAMSNWLAQTLSSTKAALFLCLFANKIGKSLNITNSSSLFLQLPARGLVGLRGLSFDTDGPPYKRVYDLFSSYSKSFSSYVIESLLSIITGFISAPPAKLPRGVYSPIVYLYMDCSANVLGDCYPAIKN